MVREIVRYPTPILRAKCRPITQVTDVHRQLALDMIDTMKAANGVGLAAPQVAEDVQMAVIDVSHNPQCVTYLRINGKDADLVASMPIIFINPQLDLGKDKATDEEGCLSFPELRAQIRRPATMKVTYQTLDGESVTLEADGLLARAFQHEIDHLNGILFIDRVSAASKIGVMRRLRRLQEEWDEDED